MRLYFLGSIFLLTLATSCKDKSADVPSTVPCSETPSLQIVQRNFHMGFTTWPFGPDEEDVDETYDFIAANADIYSHHLDNKIPWQAWRNNTNLPAEFVNDIQYRKNKSINGHQRLVSVSILNSIRDGVIQDYDGSPPTFDSLNEQSMEDAFVKHLEYIIEELQPNYLVLAMEVNELRIHNASLWQEYKKLMSAVRPRIKAKYGNIKISESLTLHNWYKSDVPDKTAYEQELSDYTEEFDFTAVSFYPFMKGLSSPEEMQEALDFLHSQTNKPIAFVETAHIAEDLVIPNFNTNIPSDECQQADYVSTLLNNADDKNYLFLIWWAYRDFDELWETFPEGVKDLGRIWRDTGLLDENGNERPSFSLWKQILAK
ncbi:MAG: glycosyl hydrolase 53 family protein [Bacteroidia bacterium]